MNKVMLIGNVGKDPDVRYFEQDQAVAEISLATTERGYTLPNGTKVPDRTDWHTVVLWRNQAKFAERFIHKGDKLYVEGRIKYRSFDDNLGKRRFVTEIIAENIELLTARNNQNGDMIQNNTKQSTNQTSGTTEDFNLPF